MVGHPSARFLCLVTIAAIVLAAAGRPFPLRADPASVWTYTEAGGKIDSSPALAWDGTLYVGSDDGFLHAINPDGSQRWTAPSSPAFSIDSTPAVDPDGTVYIGDWDFNLHAFDFEGTPVWSSPFPTANFIFSSPTIAPDGTVYVGSGDFSVYAIAPDGGMVWSFPTDGWIDSSPAYSESEDAIYFGSWDGYIYAVDSSGTLLWNYYAEDIVFSSPAIGQEGIIFIGAGDRLLALSTGGFLIWEYTTGGLVDSSPAIGPDDTVYVGSGDNHLYAFDPANGTLKWPPYAADGPVYSSPAVSADGDVFFASRDGYLYSVRSDGTLNWRIAIGGPSDSSPMLAPNGIVYIGSRDGNLYAFETTSGLAVSTWPAFGSGRNRDGLSERYYHDWIASFPDLALPEQEPLADPSGTGIPNLLAYAFSGTLDSSDLQLLPELEMTVFGEAFQFFADLRKGDLQWRPQFSEDLVTWIDVDHELIGQPAAVQTWRSDAPPGKDRGFFRLLITRL